MTKLSAKRPSQPVVARKTVVIGDGVVPTSGDEQLAQHALRVVRHCVVEGRVATPVAVVHVRPSPQQQLAKLRVDVLRCVYVLFWREGKQCERMRRRRGALMLGLGERCAFASDFAKLGKTMPNRGRGRIEYRAYTHDLRFAGVFRDGRPSSA